ncbi:putative RTA1 domain protein [Byssothecium circinans]|uniref:Putative RTA1 domain protein n=1 Tax=Byssothecium circinans TaxID=147558 RepID=A0A6A5UAG8_9PLEO|nr:putative RTA1 domain protein [Byssothecium circinans]
MIAAALIPRKDADFDLYPYTPSAAAGYAFLILFAGGGFVHLCMMFPLRAWFFIPFILGCAGEAAGYYARAWSHQNIRKGGPYLIQLMLILASAPLLAATIYMTLGRLIRALDAVEYAFMSPRWTTKIYVLIDIGSFICQMMGSAMQASGDPSGIKTGNTIVMAGLGVQLGAFAVFILSVAIFHRRLTLRPTDISAQLDRKWRRAMWMLYTVSILIVIRSVFRLVEFAEGPSGPLYNTETYIYVFDASLMFAVVVIMVILHPGIVLRSSLKAERCIPLQ